MIDTCRVTLAEDYFLNELLYSPCKDLDNISTVSLVVVTFYQDTGCSQATKAKKAKVSYSDSDNLACSEAFKLLTGAQHWILDIDLDFFSTSNPFCGSVSKVCILSAGRHFSFNL